MGKIHASLFILRHRRTYQWTLLLGLWNVRWQQRRCRNARLCHFRFTVAAAACFFLRNAAFEFNPISQ
jgi:hypothetical protein